VSINSGEGHAEIIKAYLTGSTLSLKGMNWLPFWDDVKFCKDKLIVICYNNGVKGDPCDEIVEMEIDFSINYN